MANRLGNAFQRILVLGLVTFYATVSMASTSGGSSCATAAQRHESFALEDVRKLQTEFNPEVGHGVVEIPISHFFSHEYVEELFEKMPKDKGSHVLIRNHADVSSDFKNSPGITPELLEPVYAYANALLDALNESLPESEKGKMDIEVLRIAISTGSQSQTDEGWHVDRIRYMTSVANLKGAGTVVDAAGARPVPDGLARNAPEATYSIPEMNAVVFNGFVRHFIYPGTGAEPVQHRAPTGNDNVRMGVVIFFAPKAMNAPQVSARIRGQSYSNEDSRIEEALKLREEFLSF